MSNIPIKDIKDWNRGISLIKDTLGVHQGHKGDDNIEIYASRELSDSMFKKDPKVDIIIKTTRESDDKILVIGSLFRALLTEYYEDKEKDDSDEYCYSTIIDYITPSSQEFIVQRQLNKTKVVLYKDGEWCESNSDK